MQQQTTEPAISGNSKKGLQMCKSLKKQEQAKIIFNPSHAALGEVSVAQFEKFMFAAKKAIQDDFPSIDILVFEHLNRRSMHHISSNSYAKPDVIEKIIRTVQKSGSWL